jgi:hypothetical protein
VLGAKPGPNTVAEGAVQVTAAHPPTEEKDVVHPVKSPVSKPGLTQVQPGRAPKKAKSAARIKIRNGRFPGLKKPRFSASGKPFFSMDPEATVNP